MRVLYMPLVAAAVIPALGRWLVRRVPPRLAAWSLAGGCTLIAVFSVWSYAVLAASLVEDLGLRGEPGDAEPVSDAEAVGGLVLLLAAAVCVACLAVARRNLRMRVDRALHGWEGSLVVLPESRAYAFCVPGSPGRIVVSQGLFRALSASQRRVMLAHERAHLELGHQAFRTAVEVAAAVNPLLRPARAIVAYLCERWADECASVAVGDRRLSARSLAAAALAGRTAPAGLPGYHDLGVADRVRALLNPLPIGRPMLLAWAAAMAIGALLAAEWDATADLVDFLARCWS